MKIPPLELTDELSVEQGESPPQSVYIVHKEGWHILDFESAIELRDWLARWIDDQQVI